MWLDPLPSAETCCRSDWNAQRRLSNIDAGIWSSDWIRAKIRGCIINRLCRWSHLGQIRSRSPEPELEPRSRSCTHPGSAVGFRPTWSHQLPRHVCDSFICALVAELCSDPISNPPIVRPKQLSFSNVLTGHGLTLLSAAICVPTIRVQLAHIVSPPEREWAQATAGPEQHV